MYPRKARTCRRKDRSCFRPFHRHAHSLGLMLGDIVLHCVVCSRLVLVTSRIVSHHVNAIASKSMCSTYTLHDTKRATPNLSTNTQQFYQFDRVGSSTIYSAFLLRVFRVVYAGSHSGFDSDGCWVFLDCTQVSTRSTLNSVTLSAIVSSNGGIGCGQHSRQQHCCSQKHAAIAVHTRECSIFNSIHTYMCPFRGRRV